MPYSLRAKAQMNFIVARNKSTACSPPIVAKLANAVQHFAQFSCTDSHPNPTLIVEVTDIKLIDDPQLRLLFP